MPPSGYARSAKLVEMAAKLIRTIRCAIRKPQKPLGGDDYLPSLKSDGGPRRTLADTRPPGAEMCNSLTRRCGP
eukprot:1411456-Pyramimonas_sp.AAC.1